MNVVELQAKVSVALNWPYVVRGFPVGGARTAVCGNTQNMSHKKLSRVKSLPADVTGRLSRHGVVTCKDFLIRTPLELMSILDYTLLQLQAVTADVCKTTAPISKTVLAMSNERKGKGFLPTFLCNLDIVLHGGLPWGTITEITGPSGCGKTQFCLLLCVVAALPITMGGAGVHVAYIDTESTFSAERLLEIAKSRYPDHFSSPERLTSLARAVHVFTELSGEQFVSRLEQLDQAIVEKGIGLVIVDSIASLVRKECDTSSTRGVTERASLLARQATRLKYLAESFGIPVVVTNQITTRFSNDSPHGVEGMVTAALGNSWSHCVNTRLSLQYLEGGKRMLTVAKSPLCGQESFVVSIEDKGLVLDWISTAELREQKTCGDPTNLSLSVHTDTGLRVQYPGQLH